MSNHIHLIWQPLGDHTPSSVQLSFMKYTAQQIKRFLLKTDPEKLNAFQVNKYDRTFQVWKREALSIELVNNAVFDQKLEYIHDNPVKAEICNFPEEYYYSSARFYEEGIDPFNLLTHYSGN